MNSSGHLTTIMTFLKDYRIRSIDEQTLIIEPMSSHQLHNDQPVYLVKYANIQSNRMDISDISDTLAKHLTLSKKYLLTLLAHNVVDNGNNVMIEAVYEYGRRNLREEIGNRIVNKAVFDEEELWAILSTITKALLHLEDKGIFYGVLSADKIFINQTVKLLDPSATATDPMLIAQGRLYSPEILSNQAEIDMLKSDVYVAGLIILECGLLLDLSTEQDPDLSNYFDIFSQTYSQELYALIQQMLAIKPENRPSFWEIKQLFSEEDNSFVQNNVMLLPLEVDVETPMSCSEPLEETGEYQNIDTNGDEEEKSLSQYEMAKREYLCRGNQEGSPSSSVSSSQVSSAPFGVLSQYNQQNRGPFNTSRKRSKQIKNKLIKDPMRSTKVEQVVEESFEEDSENNLFTAPELMRIIQNDLKCLKSSKQSSIPSIKSSHWRR